MSLADLSACSQCNQNCKSANYSKGEDGQYILELCSSTVQKDNTCAKCSGRCLSHLAQPPNGQYIVGFCSGTTQVDRTCADCRISCPAGSYIAGERCTGEAPQDTTWCEPCTLKPGDLYFTLNPCTGVTTRDQKWEPCRLQCPAGQYVSRDCTQTSPTECSPCKQTCPAGYYMQGFCDGTTKYDTIQCMPCKTCAEGQFRKGLAACNGSTTLDTVACTDCGLGCRAGEYVFGRCTGLSSFDDTVCKGCTVCDRDFPLQYNSIRGSCSDGTDTENNVACSLNAPEFAYPGDTCPPGYFTVGKLDSIDTELQRVARASLMAASAAINNKSSAANWQLRYDALVPNTNTISPTMRAGGTYMLVSTSVVDQASNGQQLLATNTRLEVFRGEMHLSTPVADMGNLFGNMVIFRNATTGQGRRRSLLQIHDDLLVVPEGYKWGDQPAYAKSVESMETGMATRVVLGNRENRRSIGIDYGTRRSIGLDNGGKLFLSTDRAPAVPAGMALSMPYSLRTMFFPLSMDSIFVIGGTEPLSVDDDDRQPILRSIYRLNTALNPPGWTLTWDGGSMASSLLQIAGCLPAEAGQTEMFLCLFTSRNDNDLHSLQVGRESGAASTSWTESAGSTYIGLSRKRFTTELIIWGAAAAGSKEGMLAMLPLDQGPESSACNRIVWLLQGSSTSNMPNIPHVLAGTPSAGRCFSSMAAQPHTRLFAVENDGQGMWSWTFDPIEEAFTDSPAIAVPVTTGSGASPLRLMLWADTNRLVVAGSQSIQLWTQCAPCPAGTLTANVSSTETDVHKRCLCAPGTFSTVVNFKRACAACTQGDQKCMGGYYRTLADPVCPGLGNTVDNGCARCTVQRDCPPKRLIQGVPCTGEGTNDTVRCQTCPNPCVAGVSFVSNDCAMDKYSVCTSCRDTCGPHRFVSAECNIENDTQCRQCNLVCPSGQYMDRTCAGTERADVSQCKNCLSITSCPEPAEHFVNLNDCAKGSITLLTIEKVCQRCQVCPPGTYESRYVLNKLDQLFPDTCN